MATLLTRANLDVLMQTWRQAGYRLVGPVRRGRLVSYEEVASAAELALDEIVPRDSLKKFVLPRTEVVARFSRDAAGRTHLADELPRVAETQPTVIIGARPCDAAALPVDDLVFAWDAADRFWQLRREAVRIVSVACARFDESCFCTSVGGRPDGTEGSDILLTETADGDYVVTTVSDAGRQMLEKSGAVTRDGEPGERRVAEVPVRFDMAAARKWLDENFEHSLWREVALKCVGCGACTFVCPTCHCFDLVDEGTRYGSVRRKNWDSCQMKSFTLHASGHNPRPWQEHRYRQRIAHKFSYYPERFGRTLCTGCGRCVRVCPVGLSMLDVVRQLADGPRSDGSEKSGKGEK